MKKITLLLVILLLSISSCDKIKRKAKETIKQGGETVGKTASEFYQGVADGVEDNLKSEIILSENLKEKGLELGNFEIENQSILENDNKLILYIIFNKDFEDTVFVKAINKKGLEIGRTKLAIQSKAKNAKHYDFTFDKRTNIEAKSRIIIE